MLPNYLIVGAAKSGTNTLAYYLSKHPEAYIVPQKEVNFFSSTEIKSQNLYYNDLIIDDIEDYKALFKKAKGFKAVGEGSTSYLFYDTVPQKIKSTLGSVKIIILLRNPVERTYSHYLMDKRLGLVNVTLKDILSFKNTSNKQKLYQQQYIELSLYYEQVLRYIKTFGKQNVRVYLFEELTEKTDKILRDVFGFLGINTEIKMKSDQKLNSYAVPKNNFLKKLYRNFYIRKSLSFIFRSMNIQNKIIAEFFDKKKPELSADVKRELKMKFLNDINRLEKLLDIDLSGWK